MTCVVPSSERRSCPTRFRADRSLFQTDVASSSEPHLSQSQKFLELLSFFFYFCTLLLFGLSFFFSSLSTTAVASAIPFLIGGRSTKTRSICAREFSDTFTFQLCLDSDRYFKEPLFAYRYVYIHTCIKCVSPYAQCASLTIIYCFVF